MRSFKKVAAASILLFLAATMHAAAPTVVDASHKPRAADYGCDYDPQGIHNSSSQRGTIGGGITVTCNNRKDKFIATARLQYWSKSDNRWKTVLEGRGYTNKDNTGKVVSGHHTCDGLPSGTSTVRTRWTVTTYDTVWYNNERTKVRSYKVDYTSSRKVLHSTWGVSSCYVSAGTT